MSQSPTVGFRDAIAALEQLGAAFSRYDEAGGRVIVFTGSKIDDRTLELVRHVPGIKRLDLRGTTITESTKRSFFVKAEIKAVVASCSSHAACVPAGNSPVSV